jgi:hypothetical protein
MMVTGTFTALNNLLLRLTPEWLFQGSEWPPATAIALHGLVRGYGRRAGAQGARPRGERGQGRGALRPNGAGKTTLLRLLATRCARAGARRGVRPRRRGAAATRCGGGSPPWPCSAAPTPPSAAREHLRLDAALRDKPPGTTPPSRRPPRTRGPGGRRRRTWCGPTPAACASASGSPPPRCRRALWLLDEPYAALDHDGQDLLDGLVEEARGSRPHRVDGDARARAQPSPRRRESGARRRAPDRRPRAGGPSP